MVNLGAQERQAEGEEVAGGDLPAAVGVADEGVRGLSGISAAPDFSHRPVRQWRQRQFLCRTGQSHQNTNQPFAVSLCCSLVVPAVPVLAICRLVAIVRMDFMDSTMTST